jgi:hypothetical protein
MVSLIPSDQVSLCHDMGTNKLADLLTESDLSKMSFSKNLMTLATNVLAIGRNHLAHLIGGGNEPSDIM